MTAQQPHCSGRHTIATVGLLTLAPVAAGQFVVDFERYAASAPGEPLIGQHGWYAPPAAPGGDWLVRRYAAAPIPWHRWGGANCITAEEPAAAQLDAGPFSRRDFNLDLAVVAAGPATSAGIGGFSLTPEGAATFALHMVWVDPASADEWRIEVTRYTAAGDPQREAPLVFTGLEPGVWYRVTTRLDLYENRILRLEIQNLTTLAPTGSFRPAGWYLAGGAGGGLPPATTIRLDSAVDPGDGIVLAVDQFVNFDYCSSCADCDLSGGIDFFDYLCFQERFAAGDPWADCDLSGRLDFFDFLCYQQSVGSGCCP